MDALTRMHAIPLAYIAVDQESIRHTGLLDALILPSVNRLPDCCDVGLQHYVIAVHPVYIAPASLGRLSPFCFIGNQVVGNASHLVDGLGRGTQAFALDKSISITK